MATEQHLMEKVNGGLSMTMLEYLIFGVDNSSQSHGDDRQNNFLVLGERVTFCVN